MKKLIALAALATSTPAMAADYTATEAKICKLAGLSANAIMAGRQAGIAPSEVHEKMEPMFREAFPSMMELVLIMIREAYAMPSFFTDKQQAKAIADFQAEQELFCIRHFMKN